MPDPAPADQKPAAGNPLDKAADRLRDSAKWLVAAFGAVAAVIFAGLTVADLGALSGDTPGYRLALALTGAGAAIVGIVAALSQAMRLAGASTTSLDDLTRETKWYERSLKETREELKSDPSLTTWDGDIGAFIEDYNAAYDNYVQRAEAYAGATGKKAPDQSRLKRAVYRLRVMSAIARRLLSTTSFLRLQRSFIRTRRSIAAFMVLSAIGAVAFGWATSSVPEDSDLDDRPVLGTLRPDDGVVKELNRQLASTAGCAATVGTASPVIVLDRDEEDSTFRIVTVPAVGCPPALATVPESQVTQP